MSVRFPITYATGNLIFGHAGALAGLYRLGMSSYPFLPIAGKWRLQAGLEHLAQTVGADFSLWRVNRAYPAGQYARHTLGLLDERNQDEEVWRGFLEGHQFRLAALGSHVPECYLAVSLTGAAPQGMGSSLLHFSDRLRVRAARFRRTPPIAASRLAELREAEQRVFGRL